MCQPQKRQWHTRPARYTRPLHRDRHWRFCQRICSGEISSFQTTTRQWSGKARTSLPQSCITLRGRGRRKIFKLVHRVSSLVQQSQSSTQYRSWCGWPSKIQCSIWGDNNGVEQRKSTPAIDRLGCYKSPYTVFLVGSIQSYTTKSSCSSGWHTTKEFPKCFPH